MNTYRQIIAAIAPHLGGDLQLAVFRMLGGDFDFSALNGDSPDANGLPVKHRIAVIAGAAAAYGLDTEADDSMREHALNIIAAMS